MARLGTFSISNGGVSLTRGRGRNKTVVLSVSFRELAKWAKANAIDEKKLYNRSYGKACTGVQRKLQKIVSHAGGVEGVPKFTDFESFTKELRLADNRTAPMGGQLADRRVITKYRQGDKQIIGWPSRLADAAVKFQDGIPGPGSELMFTTPAGRHKLHRKGIKDVPHGYVGNPRRILPEPFGRQVERYLQNWVQDIYYKDLAKQMAKKRLS